MKISKRPSTLKSRKKVKGSKKMILSVRKSVGAPCANIIRYNGALTAFYQRDMKETDDATAILVNSDIKALKAKYARFEKKA